MLKVWSVRLVIYSTVLVANLLVFAPAAQAENPLSSGIQNDKGVTNGSFIAPNEMRTDLYAPFVKDKTGALLSVGTFRTFTLAAYGNYQVVYMFDYDHVVFEYNKINIELIKMSADRAEYLALLFARSPDDKKVRAYRKKKLGNESFWEWLLSYKSFNEDFNSTGPWAERLKAIYFTNGSLSQTNLDLFQNYVLNHWVRELDDHFAKNFLGSDELFLKVKRMAEEGRFVPVVGDLAGDIGISSICSTLRNNNVQLDTADISNSWDYFEEEEQYRKMFSSFKACPLSDRAELFYTIFEPFYHFDAPASVFSTFANVGDLNPWIYARKPLRAASTLFEKFRNAGVSWRNPNPFVENILIPESLTGGVLNEEWKMSIADGSADKAMKKHFEKLEALFKPDIVKRPTTRKREKK